jgi:AraC-like DNA-binding protein
MTQISNERAPGAPPLAGDPLPFDVIAQMLDVVRLDGAIFLRAKFRSPWAYTSPPAEDLSTIFPGAVGLVLFHIIAKGSCWLRVKDTDELLHLEEGDVVVLPYGDEHVVGGAEPSAPVPITDLLAALPWTTFPVLEIGGDGAPTEMVCGYLQCSDLLFDPVLRALPAAFDAIHSRLPELLFVEMLRIYLEDSSTELKGWLAALRDPIVGAALAELHRDPARDWTVAELAGTVATSRSVLDERFRQLLGMPPIRYLTEWRFQLARTLLSTTDLSVAEVGARVGYSAEEAFSRAFKREVGQPPARWRDGTT